MSERLTEYAEKMAELDCLIHKELVGKTAIVISNYNGQQYGRSSVSWKGRTVHIDHAFYSGCGSKPRITVWLKEERKGGGSAALDLNELEVDESCGLRGQEQRGKR